LPSGQSSQIKADRRIPTDQRFVLGKSGIPSDCADEGAYPVAECGSHLGHAVRRYDVRATQCGKRRYAQGQERAS
jgi:hypothetical protein